jgi:hypothetical protein
VTAARRETASHTLLQSDLSDALEPTGSLLVMQNTYRQQAQQATFIVS